MLKLKIITPAQETFEHEAFPPLLIGKAADAGLILADPAVSRQHLRISLDEKGSLTAEDLTSTNGTFVNGVRIEKMATLHGGDELRIGNSSLIIRAWENPQPAPQPPSPALPALKDELVRALMTRNDFKKWILQSRKDSEIRREMEQQLREMIPPLAPDLSPELQEMLLREIFDDLIGFGRVQKYLDDPSVSEVMINGSNEIFIERGGKLIPTPDSFLNEEALYNMIDRVLAPLGKRIDERSPMVDARMSDGSRLNAIIPPISLKGPVVTIRKFSTSPLTLSELISRGTLTQEMADYLRSAVTSRRNLIVSGNTSSGKTTLLNVLSSFIPHDERIVTIEDAAELKLQQPHVIPLETKPANIEGIGAISVRHLVHNALRMRPDRIIVGECRSEETLDMLQAMNTGHDGALTTCHANSPADALKRLEIMITLAGHDIPIRAIREQIASAIQILVHMNRFPDGARRITQMAEIDGMEGDSILLRLLYSYDPSRGSFSSSGLPSHWNLK
ncbi:MAG: Flp pilus assembly complex ATPase component TadA [Deltaproteobacteria bacterium]|nr:Flp pilus assembly complex ATPase component TadA [Deltaproteobacteria bacterium]